MNKYEQMPNHNLINFFKTENSKEEFSILEIGCNKGENLKAIKEYYPKAVCYGVDISLDAVEEGWENFPEGIFYYFDIENPPCYFADLKFQAFDYILLPDVLEHLTRPEKALCYLKKLLKPDGYIFVTVPNLMHWSTMINLIVYGNFQYTDTGLLDYDHKHLFTFNEVINLFQKVGYEIDGFYNIKIDVIPDDYKNCIETLINLSEKVDLSNYETFSFMLKTHIIDK